MTNCNVKVKKTSSDFDPGEGGLSGRARPGGLAVALPADALARPPLLRRLPAGPPPGVALGRLLHRGGCLRGGSLGCKYSVKK